MCHHRDSQGPSKPLTYQSHNRELWPPVQVCSHIQPIQLRFSRKALNADLRFIGDEKPYLVERQGKFNS